MTGTGVTFCESSDGLGAIPIRTARPAAILEIEMDSPMLALANTLGVAVALAEVPT